MAASRSEQDTLLFYDDFRKFLAVDSAFDEAHKRRLQANRAQQKLLRLSANQFHELATDVHDELQRRLSTSPSDAEHLSPKESLHPKRNHARKKLSLLSPTRFNDLAFDILFEIERRNPNLKRLSKRSRTSTLSEEENNQQTNRISEEDNDMSPPPFTPTSPVSAFGNSGDVRGINTDTVQPTPSSSTNIQNQSYTPNNHHMSTSTNSTFYSDAPTANGTYGSDISSPRSPYEVSSKSDTMSMMASLNPTDTISPALGINTQSANEIINSGNDSPLQSPNNAHLQTSTLTPTKSTLVEDSDDDEEISELSDEEFSRHSTSPPGINAAMQAWAYKNSSQADITSLNPTLPAVDFSSEDDGSDDDYGLAQDFNLTKFNQNYEDKNDELDNMTTVLSQSGYNSSAAYDAMEAELMKSHPLQSIAEEKSPYIPPGIMKRASTNSPSEKRRSLSETMSSSIPGGTRSRSLNKSGTNVADQDASSSTLSLNKAPVIGVISDSKEHDNESKERFARIEDYEIALKDKDEQIELLVEEGTRMDENITKLETQLSESEALKETLVEENGRLHDMIGKSETEKDNAVSELETVRNDFKVQSELYINQLEEKQRSSANLEIQYQKLKEKHAEVMSKQTEFAGSSSILSSQIMLLESKLIKQESVISSLQEELKEEKAKEPIAPTPEIQEQDNDMAEKYELLQSDYMKLQEELQQQQQVTDQVRAEASAFLEEMRTLAENDNTWSSEKQSQQIEALKNEAQEWKSRYAKCKAQVRNLRASTYGTNTAFAQPSANAIQSSYVSPHGMIYDVSVSKFQVAMDEFILQSRTSASKGLLDHLHGVVVATRVITQDVGSCPVEDMYHLNSNTDKLQGELAQATSLVSATANHLITTTRNHSTSGGLSPIFLLDAAASDLSAAVIDLVKLAKVRPSPKDAHDGRNSRGGAIGANTSKSSSMSNGHGLPTPDSQKGKFSPDIQKHQTKNSLGSSSLDYSMGSSTAANLERYGGLVPGSNSEFNAENPADNTVTALQEYLENQTVGVIDAIQELLTGIKGSASYGILRHNITSITESVRHMLSAMGGMMAQSKHWQLKEHGDYIVDNLENCCQRLQVLYGDSAVYDEALIPDKTFKQRLAGISFDMAKCTTELVKTVEEVNLKQEINHIDEELKR